MRPVEGSSLERMKTALLDWYAAMHENGLWEDSGIPVEAFVHGGQEGKIVIEAAQYQDQGTAVPGRSPSG